MTNADGGRPRPRWAPAWGLAAFVVVNVLLHLNRCFLGAGSSGSSCYEDQGQATGWVLLVVAGLAVGAIAGPVSRSFTKGFLAGLVGLTILTAGSCTFVWLDPLHTAWDASAPARRRFTRERAGRTARQEWIVAMNARSPDVERGVSLASRVAACAFRAGRAAATPLSDQVILRSCPELAASYHGADTTPPPARSVVPQQRYEDSLGDVHHEVSGDPGWRWRLVPREGSVGSLVLVAPDTGLAYQWPRITANADIAVEVLPREGARITIEPVAELRRLAECLQGVPAEEARRHAFSRYTWHLSTMARRLCPELADRIADVPDHDDQLLLSLRRPLAPGEAPVALATYRVTMTEHRAPGSPYRFSLLAVATAGLRSYAAREDGVVRDTLLRR